jgi:predicted aspartyl protease
VTDWIVAPAVAVADAVTVVAVPTVAAALAAGAVIATAVDVTAVTATGVEVTVVLLESSTRAVMFCAPAEVGTQVIE